MKRKYTVISVLDVDALPAPEYYIEYMGADDTADLLYQFSFEDRLDRQIIAVFEGHLKDLVADR